MAGGYVYAIGMEGTDLVKIGQGQNPAKRLSMMQVGNPYTLVLLYQAWTEDPDGLEQSLHRMLHDCNHRGEWFDLTRRNVEALFAEAITQAEKDEGMSDNATVSNLAVGKQLRALRNMHDCTQTRFAEILGVKQTTNSGMEHGAHLPTPEQAARLRQQFGISFHWLYLGEDKESRAT